MRNILILLVITSFAISGCSRIVYKTTSDKPVGTDASERSFGRYIDDELIETYVGANLLKADPDYKLFNINVVSFNGIVLLTGQVKSDQLLSGASNIAKQVRNVRRVHNELTVSGPISLPARTNDTWLKTKIKSRMLTSKTLSPLKVKVVVENGVVYLMGLVNQSEAQESVEIAHKTYGVQKIVKVFEYVN
jgi:osmotically-inducible protein OsmY